MIDRSSALGAPVALVKELVDCYLIVLRRLEEADILIKELERVVTYHEMRSSLIEMSLASTLSSPTDFALSMATGILDGVFPPNGR